MKLRKIIQECYDTSHEKGWHNEDGTTRSIPEMLCLLHSEISEAFEEFRDKDRMISTIYVKKDANGGDKPEGFLSEIADLQIRMYDFLTELGLVDKFFEVLRMKMAYNKTRPIRHGGKRA